MMGLALIELQPVGLVLTWREWTAIGVSCLIIYLSYALKESLNTKALVHITRQGSDEDATQPSEGGGGA